MDHTMEDLATTSCTMLRELDISFCGHIFDKGLGYLVSKASQQFSKMYIWGCTQILWMDMLEWTIVCSKLWVHG
jgi:hypothetical protein